MFFKLFKYPGDAWTLHLLVSLVLGVAAWRFLSVIFAFFLWEGERWYLIDDAGAETLEVYRWCINQLWGRQPIWKTGFVQKAGCFKEEVVLDISGPPSRRCGAWGRKKARKEKQETKRQKDKETKPEKARGRLYRTCSDWSINWNIQLLNKQHLFHCKAASR